MHFEGMLQALELVTIPFLTLSLLSSGVILCALVFEKIADEKSEADLRRLADNSTNLLGVIPQQGRR